MRVNLHMDTFFNDSAGKTSFAVIVYVHDDDGGLAHKRIFDISDYAQQPTEEMNLNLWATSTVRSLAARMEEHFIYVDQRPEAVLIKDVNKH